MFKDNELISSLSHFIGFLLAIAGLVLLIVAAVKHGTAWHVVTFSIFGASMIWLYLASTVYHFVSRSSRYKPVFRKIDMSSIFVLIAGTYTPVVLLLLGGVWGWVLFGLAWGLALIGIFIQIFKIKLKNWQSVSFYLLMGWMIILAGPHILNFFSLATFFWLLTGGIFYTVGVLFFSLDKIPFLKYRFGLHEIFHIFVLAGSFSHFWLMYRYVVYVS